MQVIIALAAAVLAYDVLEKRFQRQARERQWQSQQLESLQKQLWAYNSNPPYGPPVYDGGSVSMPISSDYAEECAYSDAPDD